MAQNPTIIITGSSGLVGSALVDYFAGQGFSVRAFQRMSPEREIDGVGYYPFDLADVQDRGFAGADYLIHCAYRPIVSPKERASSNNIEQDGAEHIVALARRYGIKLVFLSSTSAHADAASYYARNKLFLEGLFDPRQDLILKLGLVIGGAQGLFGNIRSNLQRYKVVPLVGGGQQRIQTIALDDLCRVVESGIRNNISGTFKIAHPAVVTMEEIYRNIARTVGVHPIFIPAPLSIAYWGTRLLEACSLRLPFTSENVLGLKDMRTFNTASDIAVFGVPIKDWRATFENMSMLQ